MTRQVSLAVAAALLILFAARPNVEGQGVPFPHLFSGTVTAGGQPAPVGSVVTAQVDGVERGSITVSEPGKYGGPSAADLKLLVQGDIAPGSTIVFLVNAILADQTFAFASGEITELDLTTPELGAVPTPLVTPTPSPTPPPVIQPTPTATSPAVVGGPGAPSPTATSQPTLTATHTPTSTAAPLPTLPATHTPTSTATPVPTLPATHTPVPTAARPSTRTSAPPPSPTTTPTPPRPGAADIAALDPEAAAGLIRAVSAGVAADLIEGVEVVTAAAIVQALEPARASPIISAMKPETAARILEQVETRVATEVVQAAAIGEAAKIIGLVETSRAADILSGLAPIKAGAIMEKVSSDAVTRLVQAMPEDKLLDRLPEVSPQKLSEIPVRVLFDKLPKVPADQLAHEKPPKVDPALPPPVAVQVTPSLAVYRVPETRRLAWVKLVGSPAPIDTILGKFNRDLTDVQITLSSIATIPAGPPELLPGRIVHSLFSIDIDGAEPGDVAVVYVTVSIEKDWIEANQVHKWSIELVRYDEGREAWVPHPSKRVREDVDRVFYSVALQGFSDIAITGSREPLKQLFQAASLVIEPGSPQVEESIRIGAMVTNTGTERATYPANLWIDDTIEATRVVEAGPGETVSVKFTFTKPEGAYRLRIGRLLGSFTVQGRPTATGTSAPTSLPATTDARVPTPPPARTTAAGPVPTAMETQVAEGAAPEAKPKTGLTITILIIGNVLLLGVAGAALFYYLKRRSERVPTH